MGKVSVNYLDYVKGMGFNPSCARTYTATILVSDLSKEGYQAIDIGYIDIEYEWMRIGVDTRIAVRGKFVNEAPNGRVVSDCDNQDYLNQIVRIIN